MRSPWKWILVLAVVLPVGAFVVGTLVASAANDPAPRETIILEGDNPSGSADPSDDPSGSPSADPSESTRPSDAGESGHGDDDIEEASPSPEDVGEDDDNSGPGGGDDDDKSGHGGGDDDDDGGDDSGGDDDD